MQPSRKPDNNLRMGRICRKGRRIDSLHPFGRLRIYSLLYWKQKMNRGENSDMDTLMELSIQGDIFFFFDTLSDEEKEIGRRCMREKYKGCKVADPKIDEFLEDIERNHGIKLKRLPITSVIAV